MLTNKNELAQNEGTNKLVQIKQKVIDTGIGARGRIEFSLSEGNRIYDITAEPLKDEKGLIIGATTASLDITKQQKES